MSRSMVSLVVVALALLAYANSLGNGFANDDESIVARSPVVTEGRWSQALMGPYWGQAREGAGLYRPVTVASFTAEWRLWRGSPLGFHVVNVAAHLAVTLLVLALLLQLTPPAPAFIGASLFAVHPVHVEAVANVVGRSELYAALAFLAACLLYLEGGGWSGRRREARTGALAVLYLVGLGSKEIAVTLPAVLLLLEGFRPSSDPLRGRLRREVPVFVSLGVALGGYLLVRTAVLGSVAGESAAPWLRGLPAADRILTALSFWPVYLRLMVAPMDLVSDYSPGVLVVRRSLGPASVAGGLLLGACVIAFVGLRRRAPVMALGLGWFVVTLLPVTNLLFPVGTLVAERTLYLPSIGVPLALAGALAVLPRPIPPARLRALTVGGLVVGVAFLWRTVARNPTWRSTESVVATLAREHPESYGAISTLGASLSRAGRRREAAEAYERALALAPGLYGLTVATADAEGRAGRGDRAEALLRTAVALRPEQPQAYRLLGELLLRARRGREAHAVALEGLACVGPDAPLWAVVSEAYILKGDLEASIRARRAALGVDPGAGAGWARLAEILDAAGRPEQADEARAHAHRVEDGVRTGHPGGEL
jgi:hypothetical protein